MVETSSCGTSEVYREKLEQPCEQTMSDWVNEDAQTGAEFSGSQSSKDDPQSGGSQQVESSAFPDEDEETITMLDVIEREDKLEEEASAVLGFSDEKNCTYPKGYIARQALYSCATCSNESGSPAAICLACSLECHENHELFELYTKRNVRCDCGNSKFKVGFVCKLMDKQTTKEPSNESNKYNHNFSGRYCVCDKRYPPDENDDSAEASDEMWQCIVCEDWYHTKHLGAKELPTKFDELVCGPCTDKLDFIHYYKNIDEKPAHVPVPTSSQAMKAPVQTTNPDRTNSISTKQETETIEQTHSTKACEADSSTRVPAVLVDQEERKTSQFITTECHTNNPCESDTNDSQVENKDPTSTISVTNDKVVIECFLDQLKAAQIEATEGKPVSVDAESQSTNSRGEQPAASKGPLFWQDCTWRSKLCRCSKCLTMYRTKECEFLLDDRDTVQYYEAQGRAMAKNRESPYERGMSALNRMNRAAVVEALHGYDELKANLSSYLRKFADTKKVVREEDIHDFFAQLKTKKRQRLEFEE